MLLVRGVRLRKQQLSLRNQYLIKIVIFNPKYSFMKLKIAEKQTGHLMADLGISSNRCHELCHAIEQSIHELHSERPEESRVTLAQIVQRALVHAKDDNEATFVSITAGEYFAEYQHFLNDLIGATSLETMFGKARFRHTGGLSGN